MKLLLHICCAPCSVMCIESLRKEGIEPTGFWYNPNIHPYTEYRARKTTLEDYAKQIDMKLIIGGKYGLRSFLTQVGGDFDGRCVQCYRMRMFETARYAAENGFTHFTSTLFISPYQRHELMAEIAKEVALQYGVAFLYRDFRPFFKEGQERAREMGFYMQKYCGCIFSEEDRYQKRKRAVKTVDLLPQHWQPMLKTEVLGRGQVFVEESMDSTNRVLKEAAGNEAPDGSVALCNVQTAGRGRMDRKWIAPKGEALTLSVLIRSITEEKQLSLIPLCASIAVVKALKQYGLETLVKWPNDIVADGKKLCGILCEALFDKSEKPSIICGIGLNVSQKAFPEELKKRAVSVALLSGTASPPDRGELTAAILNELEKALHLLKLQGEPELLREYSALCATLGREVRVLSPGGEWQGTAVGLDTDGGLLVRHQGGETEKVSCGDVSIRGLADYCG